MPNSLSFLSVKNVFICEQPKRALNVNLSCFNQFQSKIYMKIHSNAIKAAIVSEQEDLNPSAPIKSLKSVKSIGIPRAIN